MKNPDAKRTKVLTPLLCRTKHLLLLTGTPALAKPKELFTLLSLLRPDIYNNFRDFGNRELFNYKDFKFYPKSYHDSVLGS